MHGCETLWIRLLPNPKNIRTATRRNILGAIAFDKNRYSDPNAFYRVLIYTDGSIKEPPSEIKSASGDVLAEPDPASFSGAEIWIFGIDGNVQDLTVEQKEQTFSAFFLKNWAHLKSFSLLFPSRRATFFLPE